MTRLALLARARDAYASRTEPEAARFLALSLWRVILLLAILAIAGSLSWGMWALFSTLAALEPPATVAHVPTPALDRVSLAETVSGLSQRSARYQEIENAPLSLPDPSR